MTRVAPWQVWWVNFDPQLGREQAGLGPAIVVGSALACGLPNDLAIVVPMTTRDHGLPFQPVVQLGDKTGYALTDQVKAISTQRLQRMHPKTLATEDQRMHPKTLATEDVDRSSSRSARMIDVT